MISWRDAVGLSSKRWKRKRIFGSLKYAAPLFILAMFTVITFNISYSILKRVQLLAKDKDYPHHLHLRVTCPSKSKTAITPAQITAFKNNKNVKELLVKKRWLNNFFADFGEVRYAPMTDICGYSKELFELYRTLPKDKIDQTTVPALLGADLLSLTWSQDKKKFVRNEKEEMNKWLGRTFNVYLNPLGRDLYEPKFNLDQLDPVRYKKNLLEKRRQSILNLEKQNAEIARRQDAICIKMQVVGFIRDFSDTGKTTVIQEETAERISELSEFQGGITYHPLNNDEIKSINILAAPGGNESIISYAKSQGLEIHDRNNSSVFSEIYKTINEDQDVRLIIFILTTIYAVMMMIIIYQLLSGQVKDSIREIGLLRCIGARRSDIMRVFIVMNLVRIVRIYLSCLVASYVFLLSIGYWTGKLLNTIDPEQLVKGNIPDFLIARIDHFSVFWLVGPWWMSILPFFMLLPIALVAAALPIWHVMGVQPSEALRD